MLLWLWRRPGATALIQPLAWEPPYAAGAALKKKRKKEITNVVEDVEKRKLTCSALELIRGCISMARREMGSEKQPPLPAD